MVPIKPIVIHVKFQIHRHPIQLKTSTLKMIRSLSSKKLQPFLKRHMQVGWTSRETGLGEFLSLALQKTNEFVPSEAGMIFLDNPASKSFKEREKNILTVVAGFGAASKKFLGKSIRASSGVIGKTYLTGEPYFSKDVSRDLDFSSKQNLALGTDIKSVLFVPITIRTSLVGVICLFNKQGTKSFSSKDFDLIRIFSDYISASIQNFLDAKRHAEASKKDSLTTLSNDRKLLDFLKKEVQFTEKRKSDLAVLFIDLDFFKEVNDEYGHLAGSRVLVEVANVLKTSFDWPRAEIARYGGDEFVVVLPGAGEAEAAQIAEEIRQAIFEFVFLKEKTKEVPALLIRKKVTTSIGIACYRSQLKAMGAVIGRKYSKSKLVDANLLLKASDDAMYLAKKNGKNQVMLALSSNIEFQGINRFARRKSSSDLNQ